MTEIPERKPRVLLAMPGLDGHDRGIVYLSQVLRDAGMEVIYLGVYNTPEQIVKTAIEEDVDVVGLSYLKDPLYMFYFPKVVELLKQNNAEDICVVAGGRFLGNDKLALEKIGITGLFQHDTPIDEIANHIVEKVRERRLSGNAA